MSGAKQQQSIFLITGNIQDGKTNYLSELLSKRSINVGGFLAPGIFVSGQRSGFRLKNIISGVEIAMASTAALVCPGKAVQGSDGTLVNLF